MQLNDLRQFSNEDLMTWYPWCRAWLLFQVGEWIIETIFTDIMHSEKILPGKTEIGVDSDFKIFLRSSNRRRVAWYWKEFIKMSDRRMKNGSMDIKSKNCLNE